MPTKCVPMSLPTPRDHKTCRSPYRCSGCNFALIRGYITRINNISYKQVTLIMYISAVR